MKMETRREICFRPLGSNFGSPPGTGGVARSAGVVANSKFPVTIARDPAALLSEEGSLFTLTSSQTATQFSKTFPGLKIEH